MSERLFLVANVSDRVSRRIDRDFGTSAREVRRRLESLQISGEAPGERFVAGIVLSGGGEWDRFAAALENARLDWRDVLVGAGLANDDWPEILDQEFGLRDAHSVTARDRAQDTVDWRTLHGAYGSAELVPELLSAARMGADEAWFDLWGMVWHQGTVYEVTHIVVPHLTSIALDPRCSDPVRVQAALLLASIASADSFVPRREPVTVRPAWWRGPEDQEVPADDLAATCREAVAAEGDRLAGGLASAPLQVGAALVAAIGAIAARLTTEAIDAVKRAPDGGDARLVAGIELLILLATEGPNSLQLQAAASLDEDAQGMLEALADWPIEMRAVNVIRDLCQSVVSSAAE